MEAYRNIYFNDKEGNSESAMQVQIDDYEFLIINPPLTIEGIDYGMTIEVFEMEGELWFKKVLNESNYITHSFLISDKSISSPLLSEFFKRIEGKGGAWETIAQGWVRLFIPKDVEFSLPQEWKEIFGTEEC